MFVRITRTDGSTFISQFDKLGNLGRYFSKCLASRKAFNVWTVVSTAHPVTGEPVTMRTRTLLNPEHIATVQEVTASNEPRAIPQLGDAGSYTVVDGDDIALPLGTTVPRHRDPATLDYYVITGYNVDGDEVRHTFAQEIATMVVEESERWAPDDDDTF